MNLIIRNLGLLMLVSFGFVTSVFAQEQDFELANEYFSSEEYDKAIEYYEKLSKNPRYRMRIYRNYLNALLKTEAHDKAEKYLKKQIKFDPQSPEFNIEYGILLTRTGRKAEADKHYGEYVKKIKDDDRMIRRAAREFINNGLYAFGEELYLEGRKNGGYNFSYELANVYALQGENEKMLDEYLGVIEQNENQLNYVQNVLQARIRDDEDWEALEPVLYRKVQQNPERTVFNSMLTWYYMQRKEFMKAFMQARAVDRRKQLGGSRIYDIGERALGNEDYESAVSIFEHLVQRYKGQSIYPLAKSRMMKAKEELIKNTFPVDLEKIRSLVGDYRNSITEMGLNNMTAESAKNMALLQAFYLNEKDTAINILESIVGLNGLKQELRDQAKLDLGDIYLLKDEWWEATLLYSQVEKSQKEAEPGHIAKLKNAKLSYYRGEFQLAKEHLDVLKLATSRKTSNDAMDIAFLIQENLGLDTSTTAMEAFASVDLLVFQQQYPQALERFGKMLKDFEGHSLEDNIHWRMAKIFVRTGKYSDALASLAAIVEKFPEDVYGDDAVFLSGEIHEKNLKDKQKAMEFYKKIMLDYQGSVFNAEARKRFRELRGDGADMNP